MPEQDADSARGDASARGQDCGERLSLSCTELNKVAHKSILLRTRRCHLAVVLQRVPEHGMVPARTRFSTKPYVCALTADRYCTGAFSIHIQLDAI